MSWLRFVNPRYFWLWYKHRKMRNVVQRTLRDGSTNLDNSECDAVKNWIDDYIKEVRAKGDNEKC